MDQDSKIRQYVLKKQQQKQRANKLREQRRNQQPQQPQGQGNGGSYARNAFAGSSRKVADPFANVNDENDNNQNTATPAWNSDTASPYDNQYDDGQSNKFGYNQSGGRGGRSGGGGGDFNHNNGPSGGAFGSSNEMGNDPEYDNYDGGGNGNCNDNWSQSGRGGGGGFRNQNQGNMNRNGRGYRNGRGTRGSGGSVSGHNMRRSNSQRPAVNLRSSMNTNTIKKRGRSQRPVWNDDTTPTRDRPPQGFEGPAEPMDNPALSRSQSSTTDADVPFATAGDVKKVLAMVEQLRGQMHALQFQLDNVKMENRKLQHTIGDLEAKMEQQQSSPPQHNLAPPQNDRFQQNNGPPPRSNNRRGNRSRDASMDVDLDMRQQGGHQNGNGPSNGPNGGNNGNMRMSQSLRQLKVKQQQSPGGGGNRNGFAGGNPRGGFSRNEANSGNNGGFDGNTGFGNGGNGGFPENDGNTGFGGKMHRGGGGERDREQQNGGFGGKMNHGLGGSQHDDNNSNRDRDSRQQRFGGGGGGRGDPQNGGFAGGHSLRGNERNDGFSANNNNGGNGNGFGMNDNRNRNGGGGGGNGNGNGGGFGMDAERTMAGHRGGGNGGNNAMHNNNGRGGMGNGNMNGNGDDDDEEIEAPPQSSADDYARKIAEQAAQFGGLQPQENEERIACHQCGRKFNQKALTRHMKICKKVFGQKRKAFNMKQQRGDDEALKASRNSNPAIEAELKRKREANKKKWKAQSAMLRNAVRSSKQIDEAMKNGVPLSELPQMESIPVEDTRVQCPHCKRKFADETAKRHIPKCQNIKSRPKMLKRRR